MADDYFYRIQQEVKAAEERLELLNGIIDKKTKEINDLNLSSDEVKKGFDYFVSLQRKFTEDEIRKFRGELEDYKERNKVFIRTLAIKAAEVGKAEEDLEVSKLDLKKRAAVLADGQKDIDKKDGELSLLLQEVQKQKDVARKSRAKGGQMLVRAEKVLKRAEERYEEVMTFESEKRKLLVDKEEHLDHQLKLTKKKRRLYEDSLEWVEKEKQKIASQWQALLSAKAHIDG